MKKDYIYHMVWRNYNMIKKQKLLYNIILTFEVKRDTFNNFIDKSPFNT